MRVLDNQAIMNVSGGETYSEIAERGAVYGGTIGLCIGAMVGLNAGPAGVFMGGFYGAGTGVIGGIMLSMPYAAMFGTPSQVYTL